MEPLHSSLERKWLKLKTKPGPATPHDWNILTKVVSRDEEWIRQQQDGILQYVLQLEPWQKECFVSAARGLILARLLDRKVVPAEQARKERPLVDLFNRLYHGHSSREDVSNTVRLLQLGHQPLDLPTYGLFIQKMATEPLPGWERIIRASLPRIRDRATIGGYLLRYLGQDHMLMWALAQHYPDLFEPTLQQSLADPTQATLRTVVGSDLAKYILRAV